MTQGKKRTHLETEAPFDERPAEDVTNDSLGTVDPADSSGLDSDEPDASHKGSEGSEMPKKS